MRVSFAFSGTMRRQFELDTWYEGTVTLTNDHGRSGLVKNIYEVYSNLLSVPTSRPIFGLFWAYF